MKKIFSLILFCTYLIACTPNTEEGERSSGTINNSANQDMNEAGQPATDSTADNTGGNGSQMTPSDNTQENAGSENSGAGGQ